LGVRTEVLMRGSSASRLPSRIRGPAMKWSPRRRRRCCARWRAHTTIGAGSSQSLASGST